ncbi:MAG: DNA recombination protein RmuC [Phycisphaerales bacterium JB050]
MEMIATILAIVCLGTTGTTVWLLLDRSKRASRLAVAERDAEEARAEAEQFRLQIAEFRESAARLTSERDEARMEAGRLGERLQSLQALHEEKLHALREATESHRKELEQRIEQIQKQFHDRFNATAAQALDQTNKRFLELADQNFAKRHQEAGEMLSKLVSPIGETLKKTDEQIKELERRRSEAYVRLSEQVEALKLGSQGLVEETSKLVNALRKPQVRGQYGEIQLERVAELAGMTNYCDFTTQSSVRDSEGNLLRPDMVVSLPNGREIVIDAKTNIEAYLDALQAKTPDDAEAHLKRFARHMLEQAKSLGSKKYWKDYAGSPEFTVMFVPGDQFVDAALEREPRLLELAAESNILLASPSTLIGLLRAVAIGWREKQLSDSAEELFKLGKELHERTAVALGHASSVGDSLDRAVKSYNRFVGSVDSRLMPTLKRFEEAGARSEKQLTEPKPVDAVASEMRKLPGTTDA